MSLAVDARAPDRRVDGLALQRRTLRALLAVQVAGGTGLAAGITVAALLAVELGGGVGASGLPEAATVAGTAAAAMPLAMLMRRSGRRRGLRLGWLAGAVGAGGAVVAAAVGSLPVLLLAMLLVGGAQAASDAARHAATDLAPPGTAGSAAGTVVAASAVSTTVAPSLAAPLGGLASGLGLPVLTGPFLLAVVGFTAAAVLTSLGLRPDPLLVAAGTPTHGAVRDSADGERRTSLPSLLRLPEIRLATVATATGNATMLALMAMVPVHLGAAQLHVTGLLVSAHLAAMFAPSPVTGRLVDRFGPRRVIGGGAMLLAAAGMLAAGAAGGGQQGHPHLAASMVLLGLGWNGCFVGGTSLLAGAAASDRPRAQGLVDMLAGVAAMAGGALAGVATARWGLATLGVLVAVAACGLAATAARDVRRRARG